MNINQDVVKGKWLEIKGEVQKAWGKLTSDEIEKSKGDIKSIAGLVQQRYGENKEVFEKKFSDIVSRFDKTKESVVEKTKESLKK